MKLMRSFALILITVCSFKAVGQDRIQISKIIDRSIPVCLQNYIDSMQTGVYYFAVLFSCDNSGKVNKVYSGNFQNVYATAVEKCFKQLRLPNSAEKTFFIPLTILIADDAEQTDFKKLLTPAVSAKMINGVFLLPGLKCVVFKPSH